jgi:hypothetical protein
MIIDRFRYMDSKVYEPKNLWKLGDMKIRRIYCFRIEEAVSVILISRIDSHKHVIELFFI